ncbi:MAG: hypothetical protein P4L81_00215 [Candidatus Pacebacteria bacterium]|nr:hypothetical protein [Candidatus Paceibacterota bacterium]
MLAGCPFAVLDVQYRRIVSRTEQQSAASGERANPLVKDAVLAKALSTSPVDGCDHRLRLYIGMDVVLTANLNVPLGIANGSRARVVRLLEDPATGRPYSPQYDVEGVPMYTVDRDVAAVYVHLLDDNDQPSTLTLSDDLAPQSLSSLSEGRPNGEVAEARTAAPRMQAAVQYRAVSHASGGVYHST